MNFAATLISWYLENKRDLPWRSTNDPYAIWLSEIILQQTRVSQGTPYYNDFIAQFPSVHALAQAEEQTILRLWQGLGYYTRARNLHATAKYISTYLHGQFPNNYKALLELKGIGSYTAAAIASFAFGESIPVVDGNVFRVLARIYGIDADITLGATKNIFLAKAQQIMKGEPALFNQAIMEFGALQCTPKKPACHHCIFRSSCFAFTYKKVDQLPVKSKKIKVKKRFFNYLVFVDSERKTIIKKRTTNDIWKNLFEFPLVESKNPWKGNLPSKYIPLETAYEIKKPIEVIHQLTHQQLYISFWVIKTQSLPEKGVPISALANYPFPIVIFKFIESSLV